MGGGTSEIHKDLDPLYTEAHVGASGAAAFSNQGHHLDVIIKTGLAAENATQGTLGVVTAVTDSTITVSGCTWDSGDTIKVYKTATKGRVISTQWVDLSRGWKTPQKELIEGWREEDIDLNRNGEKVWGSGQPEDYRR